MAIELECGQCQGRLIAEHPGSVVACPHCGTHLQVPDKSVEQPAPLEEQQPPADPPSRASGPMVRADSALWIKETAPTSVHAGPADATPTVSASQAPSLELPRIAVGETMPPAMVSRSLFLVVASYASALTLAFVFLLLQFLYSRTHQLESLPDLVPEIRHGEVALIVVPADANVPPGHVMTFGASRQFGNVKVTPLKVTQAPLQFEHELNDPQARRAPSESVLKLWLRFENVSRDQRFSPLDSLLLFKRHYQALGEPDLTNQFLCRVDERRADGSLRYVFELSPTSEFRIAGQQLNRVLGPGESVETFIPSEEQIDDLTGDLVWRVQFRKGYHPRTRRGVTTLIDVPFHRNDVKIES